MKLATKAAVSRFRKEALAAFDWVSVDLCDLALRKGPTSPEWSRVSFKIAPLAQESLVEKMLRGMK